MLAIRMQRTGRRGHAQFRVIVQDARRSPSSGQVVARLGSYNPHTKIAALNTENSQNEEAPVSVETEPEIAISEGEGTPVETTPESLEGLSDTKPADALETSAEETPVEVAIDETKNQVKIEA